MGTILFAIESNRAMTAVEEGILPRPALCCSAAHNSRPEISGSCH
jgi:hypothetical protein